MVEESDQGRSVIRIAVTQWPSLAFSVPYHVAMEKGYFEDEGISIEEVVATQGGGTTVRSILAGDLAFGEAATSALVDSQDAGAALLAVGGGVQAVGDILWVAPPDSGMSSIEDVVGSSVGYTNPGSVTQSVLAMSLDRAGIDQASVDKRATGGVSEGLTAMDGDGVAATIHAEPLYSGEPDKYKLLWRASDLIEEYQQTVVVASPELAESDPELVRGFLAARAKGVRFISEHPDEAARIWSERGDVEPATAKASLKRLLDAGEWGVGFSAEGLAAAEEGMRVAGLLKAGEKVAWKDIVSQEYLPADVDKIQLP
ncbi:ABC transporter substrate-binding protein [Qaidamihabitans albus]|uniref:ABC transporter substrate-binding protein n=1 Tax=Qaidamihabitans albus TaxID=2795733 RepID=UPI0018F127CD|nr:ABC transporter substrate-binding protein [Qaidamihabitans albus]